MKAVLRNSITTSFYQAYEKPMASLVHLTPRRLWRSLVSSDKGESRSIELSRRTCERVIICSKNVSTFKINEVQLSGV
jgi:hypothetical protein